MQDYEYETDFPQPQLRQLVYVKVKCPTCLGMAVLPLSPTLDVPCDVCKGQGEVEEAM